MGLSVKKSAKALGKSPITFNKWINDEIIPPPVHIGTEHDWKYYTEAELKIIKYILDRDTEFITYLKAMSPTSNDIFKAIEALRYGQ